MGNTKPPAEEPQVVMREGTVYKIIAIGDGACGKTSLLNKYVRKKFEKNYIPTVGVNIAKHNVKLQLKGGESKDVTLMFWDIAGQPQFYMLHKVYYNGANGILLVFDLTRTETFTHIKDWYKECMKYGLEGVPAMLVGNKIDLTSEKKIIPPMAENLAKQLNVPYYETSALSGAGVEDIFSKIVEMIYSYYQQ